MRNEHVGNDLAPLSGSLRQEGKWEGTEGDRDKRGRRRRRRTGGGREGGREREKRRKDKKEMEKEDPGREREKREGEREKPRVDILSLPLPGLCVMKSVAHWNE